MDDAITITVLPHKEKIQARVGDNLLQVLNQEGIEIRSVCGGAGSCRKCLVHVEEGEFHLIKDYKLPPDKEKEGLVLSCMIRLKGDLVVRIPKTSLLTTHKILIPETNDEVEKGEKEDIKPLFHFQVVEMEPPSLIDNSSDLDRLYRALRQENGREDFFISLELLQSLDQRLRVNNWEMAVGWTDLLHCGEIIEITPHRNLPIYGLAVDIGTTSVVGLLMDLKTGEKLGVEGIYNQQARYGDDIISRINHAANNEQGLSDLHKAVVGTINQITKSLLEKVGGKGDHIRLVMGAGNTTMIHTLLNLDPNNIRKDPYTPTIFSPPPYRAEELGIHANPKARVFLFPAIGSFVGGDIVAGILSSGFNQQEEVTLFIDIGTNGEIVLGNKDFLLGCSASAGPAFEGGGIQCGMRAMDGAIEGITISEDLQVFPRIIGHSPPMGLCGTGLIDTLSNLNEAGIIDRSGAFNINLSTPRLREGKEGYEFVLVFGEHTATHEDIVITSFDIKNLMRSKAAIYAGIRMLLKNLSLTEDMIHRVLIAGGFGNYLNMEAAIKIGLLPDLPRERFQFIGNSSLQGAQKALLLDSAFLEGQEIAKGMTYLELSAEEQGADFMDEFVAAQFLPHTDLNLFPSVKENDKGEENTITELLKVKEV